MTSDRIIQNLVFTYAELVDTGDFAGLAVPMRHASFVLNGGATTRGQEAIEKLAHDTLVVHDDGTPRTKHVTTNVIIEVDEEVGTATSRSYFTVFQSLPGFPLQAVASGRYRDRFERGAAHWHFVERNVISEFFCDVSPHVRLGAAGR